MSLHPLSFALFALVAPLSASASILSEADATSVHSRDFKVTIADDVLVLGRTEGATARATAELQLVSRFTAHATGELVLRADGLEVGDRLYVFQGDPSAPTWLGSAPAGMSSDLLGTTFVARAGTRYYVFVDRAGGDRYLANYADVQRGCADSPFHDALRGLYREVETYVCVPEGGRPDSPAAIEFAPRAGTW